MSNDETPRLGRRALLGGSLLVLAAAPVLAACGGESELTCASPSLTPEQTTARTSLHYADRTADAARACSGCRLYTGTQTACGTCTVVAGAIHPNGTCDAFVAREG